MKQRIKTNLLISSVAMMAALMTMIYLVNTMPDRLELIIAFGLIVVADTYFLVDSIIRKVDELAGKTFDHHAELTKVEKGIYSVTKREEVALNQKLEELLQTVEALKADNIRLNDELVEQQKLCTKLLMKKNQEGYNKVVNSNDRITKQVLLMSGDMKSASADTNETLHRIQDVLDEDASHAKVTRMPS